MANVMIRPGWQLPERMATPESVYWNRRDFLRRLGFAGAGAVAAGLMGCGDSGGEGGGPVAPGAAAAEGDSPGRASSEAPGDYPYPRRKQFDPGWPLTNQEEVFTYNNFYEFTTTKSLVQKRVGDFTIDPWQVEVGGLCEKPGAFDVGELIESMPMEERVYRFRCVEAWAMIVPWTGFPLKLLLDKVQPKSEAKFVRFVTAARPKEFPNWQRLMFQGYPLPYTEGLRIEEAMNELTLVTTGVFGKPLPKQNGAPIRLVVPWKYGYKSIKSVDRIELVDKQPQTLWETLAPNEYPFESNVDPGVPHPRWSQASERMIDTGDRVRTQLYNGYGSYVADLYKQG